MARSGYIYHVRRKNDNGGLLGSFTVKREAHEWVKSSKWNYSEVVLSRMVDGVKESPIKTETEIPWDKPSAREVAQALSDHFYKNKQFEGQK